MTIQTVIVENWEYDRENSGSNVYFLVESPEVVKSAIKLEDCDKDGISNTRTVYSLEEYIKTRTMSLSHFCPPAPKKGIWWLTVDEGDINALLKQRSVTNHELWTYLDHLDVVRHWHVTVEYGVAYEANAYCAWSVGEGETTFPVLVKGLAYNDKCAALVVELKGIESCNARPHITLATAENVKPVYSNQMLAGVDGAYQFLPLEAELEGQLEFFEFK